MLLDTRNQEKQDYIDPKVQNQIVTPKASVGGKIGFWILTIITLSIFYFCVMVGERKKFNQLEIQINKATSDIEIQYIARADTLTKLVGAVKQSIHFEKDLLTDITALRSQKLTPANISDNVSRLDSLARQINVAIEAYPAIKSIDLVNDLMANSDYQEREIAASRRIYNNSVQEFNQRLYVWPTEIPAAKLKLHNFPFIVASEQERKDVDINIYN